MQRLATLLQQAGVAIQPDGRPRFLSTQHRGWPYVQSADAHAHPSSSHSSSPAQQAARVAPHHQQSGLARTVNELLEQIRHMKGVKDIWEVAVKRNAMTSSLALLGGVLVADMLLYRPKQRQAVLQTSLAASTTHNSSSSNSSATTSSSSNQQSGSSHQQQGGSHRSSANADGAPRLPAPSVLHAHA